MISKGGSSNTELLELRSHLQNTKLFLNMVIHDIRNPAVSLKMGSMQAIELVKLILSVNEQHQEYAESCA